MRKVMVFLLVAMIVGAMATGAFADHGGVQTGEGKNNACPPPSVDFCPFPEDPTASLTEDLTPSEADPLFIGADDNDGNGLRVAVAIGDEGDPDSVGRVGVAADSTENSLQVYGEDYTSGDLLANTVEDLNQATGCALIPADPPESCADESNDDAVLITIH